MAKKCSVCLNSLPEDSFSKKSGMCKPCKAERYRPIRFCKNCNVEMEFTGGKKGALRCKPCRAKVDALRHEKAMEERRDYLRSIGCACCEEVHPSALEVHHLSSEYKRYGRSQGWTPNKEDLEDGLAVVLCASCHNIFHGHFGGKNAPFPTQTIESVQNIVQLERRVG